VYKYIHINLDICVCIKMYTWIGIIRNLDIYVHVYVYIYIYSYTYICIHIYIYIHIPIYIYIYIYLIHIYVNLHICIHIYPLVYRYQQNILVEIWTEFSSLLFLRNAPMSAQSSREPVSWPASSDLYKNNHIHTPKEIQRCKLSYIYIHILTQRYIFQCMPQISWQNLKYYFFPFARNCIYIHMYM